MLHRRWIVPLTLAAAVGGVAALVEACGSSASCAPGTLLLHIALLDQAPLADTITVSGDDPNSAVMNTFAHTPDPAGAAVSVEHFDVVVRWPSYYPAGNSVNLTVRALANGAQLGINTTTIHLEPGCTESSILVSNRGEIPDGFEPSD